MSSNGSGLREQSCSELLLAPPEPCVREAICFTAPQQVMYQKYFALFASWQE